MFRYGKPRILVVDDEPSICASLRLALSRAGYDVATSYSGEEAQARLMTEPFDVMILDLRMKDMRGDVVYHIGIGAQPHLRHATVFITGDITDKAQDLIRATGCEVIGKPYELSELLDHVHSLSPRVQPASA